MPASPKTTDTTISCTASELAQAADALLKLLPKGAITKSRILNVMAASIAGPKHDWGLIKGSPKPIVSKRLRSEPALASEIQAALPAADEPSPASSVEHLGPFDYPQAVRAFLGANKPLLIVSGKPGSGLVTGLSEEAASLDIEVHDIRLAPWNSDVYFEGATGVRRLRPELRPTGDGELLFIYNDIDGLSDEDLQALTRELSELRDTNDRIRVALVSVGSRNIFERLRKLAPEVLTEAVRLEVGSDFKVAAHPNSATPKPRPESKEDDIRISYGRSNTDKSATIKIHCGDLSWAFLEISGETLSDLLQRTVGQRAPDIDLTVTATQRMSGTRPKQVSMHFRGAGAATLRVRVPGLPDTLMSYENLLDIILRSSRDS